MEKCDGLLYLSRKGLDVNAVEQAYWDLVYSLQNLEVKRESLRIAQELNRITRIKIDVGSLAPIDITQTEVGIATAEQDIIISEGQIGDAQDRLATLTGAGAEPRAGQKAMAGEAAAMVSMCCASRRKSNSSWIIWLNWL